MSDPIADFLTRIRNATQAKHRYVDCDWSKLKEGIATILKEQKMIDNYLVRQDDKHRGTIRIFLKYTPHREPIIQGLRRVSRPGLRRYVGHEDIPHFYGGLGIAIVSTSQGLLAGEDARKRKIGGELLCMVW